MKHIDSGIRCLAGHGNEGQCIQCSICGEFIRPEDWYKSCKVCPVCKGELTIDTEYYKGYCKNCDIQYD